ncbi:peptide-methionine (S)-S-oxide reductase MsrA [Polymorphobacter sp.]|uniref:peptide-methionine (S)-S-oxide reductase MsrA n=1 Tax=Polymorphobacter sp. TaxID=1909290 RepID=UPI003F6F5EC5
MRQIFAALLVAVTGCANASAAERMLVAPAPVRDETPKTELQTAVLAGGCFWGVEGVFERLQGVTSVKSGYAGGNKMTAKYSVIGTGLTGHAEAVEIRYDPKKITYGTLLRIFYSVAHDPTQLNRQGPDTGTQYRSAIFPQTPEQAQLAKAYIAQLEAARTWGKIVTTIEPDKPFYTAETYHQNYLRANPTQPYIVYNDLPKVEALKKLFPTLWSNKPAA